jgi:hypothetical protein
MKHSSITIAFLLLVFIVVPNAGFAQGDDQAPFDWSELSRFMSDYPGFASWLEEAGETYGAMDDPSAIQSMAFSENIQSYLSSLGWEPERFFYILSHVGAGLSAVLMEQAGVDMAAQMAAMQNNPNLTEEQKQQMMEAVEQSQNMDSDLPAEEIDLIRDNKDDLMTMMEQN